MSFLKTKEGEKVQVDFDRPPRHVVIIINGNGHWAKYHGLLRMVGYTAGVETFRSIATYCQKVGLKYLIAYVPSTENWKRLLEEVSAIVDLLKKYLLESIEKMEKDKVKLHFLGDLEPLPQELKDMRRKTSEISERYEGIQVNVCFDYGGRDETARAARHFIVDCVTGEWRPKGLTEVLSPEYPCSSGISDPNLMIRPSGEACISNFLLWQSVCTELYLTDVLWPDLSKEELHRALATHQGRPRRLGGV